MLHKDCIVYPQEFLLEPVAPLNVTLPAPIVALALLLVDVAEVRAGAVTAGRYRTPQLSLHFGLAHSRV